MKPGYTVFGQVVEGMETIDQIAEQIGEKEREECNDKECEMLAWKYAHLQFSHQVGQHQCGA